MVASFLVSHNFPAPTKLTWGASVLRPWCCQSPGRWPAVMSEMIGYCSADVSSLVGSSIASRAALSFTRWSLLACHTLLLKFTGSQILLALSPLFFSFFLLFFLFGCRTLWLIDWLAYSVVLLSSSPSSCSFFAFLWFDSLARTISSMVSSLVLLYLCCCCY